MLQEAAAARRSLIVCGLTEIDGFAFCSGLERLMKIDETRESLMDQVRPITLLIGQAIYRPRLALKRTGRASLNTFPLVELIDIYHTHEATKLHDKIYALLGMSTDDIDESGLLPDYQVPWNVLLQRLVEFVLGRQISIKTWIDREMVRVSGNGCVFGTVDRVQSDFNGRFDISIRLNRASEHFQDDDDDDSWEWSLQAKANSAQEEDIVCQLQGAPNPIIIRPFEYHCAIIMISTVLMKRTTQIKTFPRFFLIVWDWKLMQKDTSHSWQELQDNLSATTRMWNIALILKDAGLHEKAEKAILEAIQTYAELPEEDGEIQITGEMIVETLVYFDKTVAILLLHHMQNRIHNTAKALTDNMNRFDGKIIGLLLDRMGDKIPITEHMLQKVMRDFDEADAIARILERRTPMVQITKATIEAAAMNNSHKVIEILFEYLQGSDIPFSEAMVEATAGNVSSGKEIMTLLVNLHEDKVMITEAVVQEAAENIWCGNDMMMLLLNRRGNTPIAPSMATMIVGSFNEDVVTLSFNQEEGEVQITETMLKAVIRSRYSEKVRALLLSRGGDDIRITQEVITAAARSRSSELMSLLLDRKCREELGPGMEESEGRIYRTRGILDWTAEDSDDESLDTYLDYTRVRR